MPQPGAQRALAARPRSISLVGPNQPSEGVEHAMRRIALLALTAGALALSGVGTAVAAPAGPEGPDNCTFEMGITTCTLVGEPVITESIGGFPCGDVVLPYTIYTTTVTTTYSRHRGAYNTNGQEIERSTSTSSSSGGGGEAPYCEAPSQDFESVCRRAGGLLEHTIDPPEYLCSGDISADDLELLREGCEAIGYDFQPLPGGGALCSYPDE